MKIVDVNKKREQTTERFDIVDFDGAYCFYYDETNNLKKFYIRESEINKESEFNYSHSSNFILGGLVFKTVPPDLSELFFGLNLQKSVTEVKLKHLAKGEFLDCIKSEKLHYFLKYLYDKEIHIHFTWVNLLYWSVADIVDSAILNSYPHMFFDHGFMNKVRSDLYRVAKIELKVFTRIFYKYQYPNIKKDSIITFIDELIGLLTDYTKKKDYEFGMGVLIEALEESKKKKSLPFLRNEQDHILLQDFNDFYLEPICLFKNSIHVFDEEQSVTEVLENTKLMSQDKELKSYSFVKSHDSQIIQACDVVVGILGKFSSYLNTTTESEVKIHIKGLTIIQQRNLDLIIDLMDRSVIANPAFIISYDSDEEKEKMGVVYTLRNKTILGPII